MEGAMGVGGHVGLLIGVVIFIVIYFGLMSLIPKVGPPEEQTRRMKK
jgi:hypothetical protein